MRSPSSPVRVLLLATVLAAIPGCKFGAPRVAPGSPTRLVTLKYLCWGDDTEIAMNQAWIDMFEAEHPNVRVDMRVVSGQGFDQVLLTQIAGGIPPDVTYVTPQGFPNLVRREIYEDLTPYMERDGVSRDEYLPNLLKPYESEGRVYGLPRSWHPFVIFYNKRLFQRFGVEYPSAKWTWDDFIAAGKRLTRDEDGDGAPEFRAAANFPFQPFVWSCGGDVFGPDGEFLLDEPRSLEGLQLYIDMIHKHGILPLPGETQGTQSPQQMFETGRLAMFALGIWCVPAFRRIERFEWDIAPMPRGSACRATLLVTAGWGVIRTSRHKEEAWQLVRFLAGRQAQEYQMRIWRDPSPRVDAFVPLMNFEPEKPPPSRQVVLDSVEFGRFDTYFVHGPELWTELNRELGRLEGGFSDDVRASVAKMRADVEARREELVEESGLY